ncbi:hypothetical protein EVAR_33095_1 [Eumeta japonica]|uniref:Uncharacterized protein n=1 Tax=Eumeta variegata TaxID=151549 RepID=A0A4C1YBR6_EUMVA|nr:hypothetical protein EVAR_33095_1 [Eumeta japonica]
MNESNGKGNWSKVAEECRNRYNETNHSVTGFSPKYLLSGRTSGDRIGSLELPFVLVPYTTSSWPISRDKSDSGMVLRRINSKRAWNAARSFDLYMWENPDPAIKELLSEMKPRFIILILKTSCSRCSDILEEQLAPRNSKFSFSSESHDRQKKSQNA